MTWWKFVGLAGFFGTPEGAAAVRRAPRPRGDYTPAEVTARLHERLAESRAQG
ncbi:hypothetical protein [Nocardioides jiangxiensis]|uniref:DivIVA domain-containing protein n=1 Tax=Nocardioides jiangxiensis TaxID=3064524 RepID=A0ABT9AYL2_9ACTN|nr:hypothetical protein [Nocardioides sp. WY-20]MDO7867664.1 hypothetical protein [Nocardioides sp. WY-20]